MLDSLKNFRRNYLETLKALPFLDCYFSDMPASWDDAPKDPVTPYRKLSFTEGNPRLVKQTDHSFEEIAAMAENSPEVDFIIASGDRKMLYHIAVLEELIAKYPNLYLCTAAVCNPFFLEHLVERKLTDKVLYGSMTPYLAPGQALAPVVLGKFDWATKCAIAGNNFRKLLGEAPVTPPELPTPVIPQIMIDTHTHTLEPGMTSRFPAPSSAPVWAQWEDRLDYLGVTHMFCTPSNAIRDVATYPSRGIRDFCVQSAGRVRYFEVFDPNSSEDSLRQLEASLPDPLCVGIKIHPACHGVDADDPRYEAVFAIAAKYGKPIMSHTWGVSDYNPTQKHSVPNLFDKYLTAYPDVKFVFGHTGGRPNGFVFAAEMCRKHPQCMGDLAGDLFNNGFVTHALKEIGADRIMFATDMYWIDPRCVLGMLLDQEFLSDEELFAVLRRNAERFYLGR